MNTTKRPVAIMTALAEELAILKSKLVSVEQTQIGGFDVYTGQINGKAVVLAKSAAGKVNAANLASIMLSRFSAELILFSGVAGGLNPQRRVGDLIVSEQVIQYDYGAIKNETIHTYGPGDHCIGPRQTGIEMGVNAALRRSIARVVESEGASFGRILTGDQFINCEKTRKRLFADFNGDAVEMEGGAVAQVASGFRVPWLVVRCLSDLAGDSSDLDFQVFLKQTADRASRFSLKVLAAL